MTYGTRSKIRWILPLLALGVAACAKQENQELMWARAALERNPDVEILAADAASGVFTLRDRHSGEVTTVALQELAAAPVAQLMRKPLPLAATAPAPAQPEPASAAAATPAPVEEPATESTAAAAAEPLPQAEPVAAPAEGKPYVIDRSDGQLRVSGPGISVVSAGPATTATSETQGARSSEPIICEGRRMLHLDNRNLNVDGDAITVRGGCELYLTNSNVVASGTGVRISDGTVHIANSYVEGAASSFDANSEARVYIRGSTFQGLPRRDQLATVQDQGGNRWR